MISTAIFCPQSKGTPKPYLDSLRLYLTSHPRFEPICSTLQNLHDDWDTIASDFEEFAGFPQGPRWAKSIREWIVDGHAAPLADAMAGTVCLPLLVVMQVCQYLQFLEVKAMTHSEMIAGLKGGAHGYCGGILSAVVVACALNEEDIIQYACVSTRVAFAIGIAADFGEDDESIIGPTTIVARIKRPSQLEELLARFPGTYHSANTDATSVSIVGPVLTLKALSSHAKEQGIIVQDIHLRGKVHNPENKDIADRICLFCESNLRFRLPEAHRLRVPVRSNITGDFLVGDESLAVDCVQTILAARCEWHTIMKGITKDLQASHEKSHTFASFGIGDVIPIAPFNAAGLKISKLDVRSIVETALAQPIPRNTYEYADDAVAIIGASCRVPGAESLEELWDLLARGESTCQEVPSSRINIPENFRARLDGRMDKQKFYGNFIDNVDAFDHTFFHVSPKEAQNMDPQQRILLEAAYQAMESSGYMATHDREAGDSVGCFIGTSFIEYLESSTSHPPTAFTATGTIGAFLCGRISYHFGWTGPSEMIDTACSSSLVAINRAVRAVQTGECPIALAGGINIIAGCQNFLNLGKAGFLSQTGQCKPFDAAADGYCRSEGVGLVVLKSLKQALEDADPIMGIIPGIATNQGGLSASLTIPSEDAQVALYQGLLRLSKLRPDQITYAEAHGTGTQAGDPVEIASLLKVFGGAQRADHLYVGSLKGNIGHLEPAAGVAGLLKVLAMMKHSAIPQQVSLSKINPKFPPLESEGLAVVRSHRPWQHEFKAALVCSYGAAGSNAAMICCQPPARLRSNYQSHATAYPLRVGANSEQSLYSTLAALKKYLRQSGAAVNLADLSFTLSKRRETQKFQWAARASSIEEAISVLGAKKPSFEKSALERHVVLLFSGQSKQNVLLDKQFYDEQPLLRHHIEECSKTLFQYGFPPIVPAIFQKEAITDTVVLQCATFVLQYACAKSWIDSGLKVDAIIGHSFGELTGLVVSGALSLKDGIKLVATRAMLMKTKWGAERGSMLAILCDPSTLEKIAFMVPSVEVACYNALSSQVLVGTAASINELERLLPSNFPTVKYKRLDVSHGFHSRLTEPLLPEIQELNDKLSFRTPTIPLETCTENPQAITMPDYLAQHTRMAVYFSDAIRRVERRLGACVFLESGTDTPIAAMAKNAAENPTKHVFQSLSPQKLNNDLASATVSLWREGLSVSYWAFSACKSLNLPMPQQIWLPPYQFDRSTSFWLPFVDRIHEAQNSMKAAIPVHSKPEEPRLLVSSFSAPEGLFMIHTSTERFSSLISGHAVRGQPLCPASLYMECATMAVQLVGNDFQGKSLVFENISFSAPLGTGISKDTMLSLEKSDVPGSWQFAISSSMATSAPRKKPETHATGKLTLASQEIGQNALVERLVADRFSALKTRSDVDNLSGARAYSMFSRVVRYSGMFKGITSIAMAAHEAIAAISVPPSTAGPSQSTVMQRCETVALDTFIHVLGLLINSSDHVDEDCVCVATGLDSATITTSADFNGVREYDVYTTFTRTSQGRFVGDVFTMARSSGQLVCTFAGVHFSQLPITKLETLLQGANRRANTENTLLPLTNDHRENNLRRSGRSERSRLAARSQTARRSPEVRPKLSASLALKEVISTYNSLPVADLQDDATMADLGIDSLAAVDLSELISDKFGITINPVDLLCSTIASLTEQTMQVESLALSMADDSQPFEVADKREPVITPVLPMIDVDANHDKVLSLIHEATGILVDDMQPSATLQDLGADSLSFIELKYELESCFGVNLDEAGISTASTVHEILETLALSNSGSASQVDSAYDTPATSHSSFVEIKPTSGLHVGLNDAHSLLPQSMERFENKAREHGFERYWDIVNPEQEHLLVAYIVEALAELKIHLQSMQAGDPIPPFTFSKKHEKVVSRLLEVLKQHGIIEPVDEGVSHQYVRASGTIPEETTKELSAQFSQKYPAYTSEVDLMKLTGPRLAACLRGTADPVALLFGNPVTQEIVAQYYKSSPTLATMTEQLVDYLATILEQSSDHASIRILEVGAGSGATTTHVAQLLSKYATTKGLIVEYVFTDISANLVRKAARKLAQYSFISFKVLDLENLTEDFTQGSKFDIIIGTNCVHATSNRTAVCAQLRTMLWDNRGLLILSEVTDVINWYDGVFGLLDGWWMDSSNDYAIQPASYWMNSFRKAGFSSWSYSTGPTREANSQQLLVAANFSPVLSKSPNSAVSRFPAALVDIFSLETVVYKKVDATSIRADIYFPAERVSSTPMAIALMIHGGGHITLTREHIRPYQAAYLLEHNVLPVSIDYRLCPEINLIDGPMADVRDAVSWARTALPSIAGVRGITLDPSKVVMIGWSSGGHLAMTTAWTTAKANMPPPTAILSFYAPVSFEPEALDGPEVLVPKKLPPGMGKMPLAAFARQLSGLEPITGYDVPGGGEMGWIRPGDARCELVMSLFREERALEIMLHGIDSVVSAPPTCVDPTLVRYISPLAQAKSGAYRVPTFIVHGDCDEVVPLEFAGNFISTLKAEGVNCGFLPVRRGRHLHDLAAKPGTKAWEQGVHPGLEFLVRALSS